MATVMAHSPADIIRWLLIALGQGSDPGDGTVPPAGAWPVFKGGEPSSPDEVITVRDTTGQKDGRSLPTGEIWTHYGFQIRVRDLNEASGYAKTEAIRQALATQVSYTTVTIGSSQYLVYAVSKIGETLSIGKQPGTRRSLFTLNALSFIDPL